VQIHRRCQQRGGGALWPNLNLNSYEHALRVASASLGIQQQRLTPHMARHGGISSDIFEKVVTLEEGGKRGHWRTAASIRRYEKHARLLRMIAKLPAQLQLDAQTVARTVGATLMRARQS
jgi:hypothetical protein